MPDVSGSKLKGHSRPSLGRSGPVLRWGWLPACPTLELHSNLTLRAECQGRLEAYPTSLVEESMLFALTVSQVFQSLGVTGIVTIIVLAKLAFIAWFCFRFMPNNSVGVVEKLWSSKGSVPEGHILALNGEAGFQADLL